MVWNLTSEQFEASCVQMSFFAYSWFGNFLLSVGTSWLGIHFARALLLKVAAFWLTVGSHICTPTRIASRKLNSKEEGSNYKQRVFPRLGDTCLSLVVLTHLGPALVKTSTGNNFPIKHHEIGDYIHTHTHHRWRETL